MSAYEILQVSKEYRAGQHQFITVGGSNNLYDPLNDQIDNVETTTLTIIEGNVGIGTTKPLQKLHVEGNIYANGTVMASNLQILGDFVTLNTLTSNTDQLIILNAGTGPALQVTQTGMMPIADFYDDENDLVLRIADGANVGIGTSLPTVKLHIEGDTYTNGTFTSSNLYVLGDTTTLYTVTSNLDRMVVFNVYPGPALEVTQQGNDTIADFYRDNQILALRVAKDGNVGIGTSTPYSKLHVEGDVSLAGHLKPTLCNLYDLGTDSLRWRDLYLTGDSIYMGDLKLSRSLEDEYSTLRVVETGTSNTAHLAVRNVYTDGSIFVDGNVGVGTRAPIVSFDIHTTDGMMLPKGTLAQRPSPGTQGIIRYNTETLQFEGFGAGDVWGSLGGVKSTDQTTYISAELSAGANDSNLRFVTGDHLQMIVRPDGNVGIGTDLPTAHLHILHEGAGDILRVDDESTGTSRFVIIEDGNVGIGTAIPQTKLHVEGDIYANGTVTASNLRILGDSVILNTITSNTEQIVVTNAGTGPAMQVTQTGPQPIADFYDDGNDLVLRIADGGNVGIGTSQPYAKLHVEGDITLGGHLLPTQCNVYDLGSSNLRWKDLYLVGDSIFLGDVKIERETIEAGGIRFMDTDSGLTTQLHSRHVYTDDSVFASGNIGIGTTMTASNLSLEIHSTNGILLPRGTTSERPDPVTQGTIRYNSETFQFEGFGAGSVWGSLGGVKSTDQTTYISAELTAGANDSNLRFVTGDRVQMIVRPDGNIGIGTDLPLAHLHLLHEGSGDIFRIDDQISDDTRLIVTEDGNVGIGTSIAKYTLDVEGGEISTSNVYTSNLTIKDSFYIYPNSTTVRTRMQVHHIRQSFYVEQAGQSNFTVTYPGAFSGHQSNVQVYVGRNQLSYYSPEIKDYDLEVTYNAPEIRTEYTVTLTTPTSYGDIVDIIVWPQITQNSPENQALVYMNAHYNDSYWRETGCNMVVRSNVPIYVYGNVGVGTDNPIAKLDIVGTTRVKGDILPHDCNMYHLGLSNERFQTLYTSVVDVEGSIQIEGQILPVTTAVHDIGTSNLRFGTIYASSLDVNGDTYVTGNIYPTACNVYDLGSSNYRFKDLYLSGKTIDLGGTFISRQEITGGIVVTNSNGDLVDTSMKDLIAQGNVGIGITLPIERIDIDGNMRIAGNILPATSETYDLGSSNYRFRDIFLSGNTINMGDTLIKRHVTGPLMVQQVDGSNMESLHMRHLYTHGTMHASNVVLDAFGQAPLVRLQNNTSDVVTVTAGGNVGIGISSPSESLHVIGNILASGSLIASNLTILGASLVMDTVTSNTERMVVTNDGSGSAIEVTQLGPYPVADFIHNTSLAMRIADGGYVGVGTAFPLARFHILRDAVEEALYVSGTDNTQPFIITPTGNVGIGTTAPGCLVDIQNATSGTAISVKQIGTGKIAEFADDGGARVTFAKGGNVGIGTATPGKKVDIVGTLRATSLDIGDITNAHVPRGAILMWSGSIATIPTGWAICDGTNGTPNLRDRFVVGAGSSYAVAATGGATTVTLATANLPSHNHTGTTDSGGNHNHAYTRMQYFYTAGYGVKNWDGGGNQSLGHFWNGTEYGGSHTHTFTTSSVGSGTAFGILPPYYALAYIMKL